MSNEFEVKVGTVVVLKTSKEPVYVLDIVYEGQADGSTNPVATVRRPVQSEDGVRHDTEEYQLGELQTIKEKMVEELSDASYFLDQRKKFDKSSLEKSGAVEVIN